MDFPGAKDISEHIGEGECLVGSSAAMGVL